MSGSSWRGSTAEKRKAALQRVEASMGALELAEQRVNAARSELGTAEAEFEKIRASYAAHRRELERLFPPADEPNEERCRHCNQARPACEASGCGQRKAVPAS